MSFTPEEVVITKKGPVMVELQAVLAHQGPSIDRGHYVAYIRRDTKWYCASDNEVRIHIILVTHFKYYWNFDIDIWAIILWYRYEK